MNYKHFKSYKHFTRLLLASIAALPVMAHAQDGAVADGVSDKPESKEIIVTAQRRDELLEEVPIAITVLDGDELDTASFSDSKEALRTLPGLDLNLGDTFTQGINLSVRGVSNATTRAGGAGVAAYYIDGVPFGFVRHAFYPSIGGLYDLDQIEFLRGPQGTLYGANSLNGVLRINTNDADPRQFEAKAKGAVETTRFGGEGFGVDAAVNVPLIEDRLAVRAVVGYRDNAGWIDGPLGKDLNSSTEENYRIKLRALPTDTLEINLMAWLARGHYAGARSSNDHYEFLNKNPLPDDEKFDVFGAEIIQEFEDFTVSSNTSYIDYTSDNFFDITDVNVGLGLTTTLKSRVITQEINLVSSLEGPWRWSAGAFYRDAKDLTNQILFIMPDLKRDSPSTTTVTNNDYSDRSKSYAIYGELGRKFFDEKFDLAVGLRYFHDDESTRINSSYLPLPFTPFKSKSEAVTPRVVATWFPSADHTLYASYSQGFRSGFAQQPNVQVASAGSYPPVKPDKLHNYEIGWKGSTPDRVLSFEAAAYYIDWKDVQQNVLIRTTNCANPDDQNTCTTTTATVNGTSASGLGAELSLTARPTDEFQLGANVTYNDLQFDADVSNASGLLVFEEGARLPFSAKYTLGFFSRYNFPLNGRLEGRIGLSGDLKSPQDLTAISGGTVLKARSDSIFIGRANVGVEDPDLWSLTFYVENFTNEKGAPSLSPLTPLLASRPRPRTIGAQIEFRF